MNAYTEQDIEAIADAVKKARETGIWVVIFTRDEQQLNIAVVDKDIKIIKG